LTTSTPSAIIDLSKERRKKMNISITESTLCHVFSQVLRSDIGTYKTGYTITKEDELKVSNPMYLYKLVYHVFEELGIEIVYENEHL
jgi:hypothetical protein